VTLVARSTLGEPLRRRLAGDLTGGAASATTLLADAGLIEQLAGGGGKTLADLKRALAAGTVSIAGGLSTAAATPGSLGPESLLDELTRAQKTYRQHLGQEIAIYAQFTSAFSPLLPGVLSGTGFRGALHAAFDGGRVPRAEQCKTRWGPSHEASLDTLSATPLDTARPETWLALAERISDSISRDHVATVLLAGWPGQEFGAYDDVQRICRRSPLLGKLVTLDQYFDMTAGAETWTTFHPAEYRSASEPTADAVASHVAAYRGEVADVYRRLEAGLCEVAPQPTSCGDAAAGCWTLNAWNFDVPRYGGLKLVGGTADDEPTDDEPTARGDLRDRWFLSAVPGCGFAWHAAEPPRAPPTPIAEGRRLCNEFLEVVVSDRTGGIQSVRTHRERRTRVSQRLVYSDSAGNPHLHAAEERTTESIGRPPAGPQMLADAVGITGNDTVVGEITSRGRLIDAAGEVVARFSQTVRLPRALPAVLVDVSLDAVRPSQGSGWTNAILSRVAWRDEGATIRRGASWVGRPTVREPIDSAEWVEIDELDGRTTIFPLGLPFHRRIGMTMLDTLLAAAGETHIRRQFAIGLDVDYPTQLALALLTADAASATKSLNRPGIERGWYLHVDAKNVVMTHVEPLVAPRAGVRLRLLETEGRAVQGTLAAFRPLVTAQEIDFRGSVVRSLRTESGAVSLHLEPHQWLGLEAEW
jgi:hypothetical protein